MAWGGRAALAAVLLAGATSLCFAQAPSPAPASPSFDDVVGKRLIAIDGSTISLMAVQGGLARDVVAANGSIQKTYFVFINDRLGTVADGTDLRKVIGVFRRVEAGVEIEYADGSTETLAANPSGGITAETISAAATSCVAWYPEGHQFSLDERKAALAVFATRLGLSDPTLDSAAKSSCGTRQAKPVEQPKSADIAPKPEIPAPASIPRPLLAGTGTAATTAPLKTADVAAAATAAPLQTAEIAGAATAAPLQAADVAAAATAVPPKSADVAAAAQAIEVRKSEVHPIDPTPAAEPQKPQVLASAYPPNPLAPDQHGASSCLSVESDGMHWGFRNHCGYTVQFAYCLMSGSPLASCKEGAIAGSVAGNGFGALIADQSLKETDAEHDFRWVACQGGAGEVIPRLDQTNPPAGRCVR